MLTGLHAPEVLKLLLARKSSGARGDGHKLGLVVEGGAMRGVYTAGSLLALDVMKCHALFDAIYATSAGVINAAHFLSLSGAPQTATYYRALCDGRFFHPYRLWNMVDTGYFIREVLQKNFPLDLPAAQKSDVPLFATLLDYETARLRYVSIQEAGADGWDLIKATVAMPVVSRAPRRFRRRHYLDAGFAEPYPLQKAIEDGCTHVLVLSSRDLTVIPAKRTKFQRGLFHVFGARGNRALMEAFDQGSGNTARLDAMASGRVALNRPVSIATFSPRPQHVHGATMEPTLLRDGVLQMAAEVLDALSHPTHLLEHAKATGML